MRLLAYVGTSLRPSDVDGLRPHAEQSGVDLAVRPPIIREDLLTIADTEHPATRVLILDGEFGQQLSVSATEIREYLATGRYLAGGSSMGALRSVECRTLGMRMHGWVAARYLDGTVNADDEVALLYDPDSFEPVTVPLVNFRWLLHRLVLDGALDRAAADDALTVATNLHYRTRTPDALARGVRRDLPERTASLLTDCLAPAVMDAWDRKRLDALDAVRAEVTELAPVGASRG
ncbi:TfuA-like protein [Actinokineospora sp.]|uniref:TfuA-like protein n=1 Tax=Actinokineospora sp. TaxID=1872133 RepID=UPI00403774DD